MPEKSSFFVEYVESENSRYLVVFLHGGPGYTSYPHRQQLEKLFRGKNVDLLIYDRKGEGQSWAKSEYTFDFALNELFSLIRKYQKENQDVYLLGFSFGGTLALRALESERIKGALLVSTPINYPHAIETIYQRCFPAQQYKFPSNSIEYAINAFSALAHCDAEPNLNIDHVLLQRILSHSQNKKAMLGYFYQERYTLLDDFPLLRRHANKIRLLNGNNDWVLSEADKTQVKKTLPDNHWLRMPGGHFSPMIREDILAKAFMDLVLANEQ